VTPLRAESRSVTREEIGTREERIREIVLPNADLLPK